MARNNQASERNTFVGGFLTEVSPLTFPDNAAIDLSNFELNKNGTIKRRLGVDFENGFVIKNTTYSSSSVNQPVCAVFDWPNPGGYSERRFIAVQVGYALRVFDAAVTPISDNQLYSTSLPIQGSESIDSAVVDGLLILSTGSAELIRLDYDGTQITSSKFRLKVRDTFGVEHVVDGVDYRDPDNIDRRLSSTTGKASSLHEYNLRNSSWSVRRYAGNDETIQDPIKTFYDSTNTGTLSDELYEYRDDDGTLLQPQAPVTTGVSTGFLPSYADKLNSAILTDATDEDNRNVERFFPEILVTGSDVGKYAAPNGHFIIDLLERGSSRVTAMQKLHASASYSTAFEPSDIPSDRTPSGAKCVAEYAGRLFYAGFSGEVIGGDKHSPRLSSYVVFSKLVESPTEVNQCFQVGDPTSKDGFDIVDTDGGFIRLDGAYNIKRLINVGSGLLVLAENGVWAITGGSDYGFTATDNKVTKISDKGCLAKRSVVFVEGSVLYWSSDGIYLISRSELGDLTSKSITTNSIQTFFDNISTNDKINCQGFYDSYENKIRWVYGNNLLVDTQNKELVFDLAISSFYKNDFPSTKSGFPALCSVFETPPYRTGLVIGNILVGSDEVKAGVDDVVATVQESVGGQRELSYLAASMSGSLISFSFANYNNIEFIDWFSQSGGQDAEAFLITGYDGGGDFQREKQTPYITFHFNRTEDGFEADELGDLYPTNQSGCLVQAHWNWTNSANSNRWTKPFQAYRYKRLYMPEDGNDSYDTGDSVITTKNRLRGKGKVLSIKINSEPSKDCQLLGWSMLTSVQTNV